ncbi:uncharacterized protein [Lepisosteus oculatus]|uniref:uncharacterized protein n=1 Tax=Lepisosteus oculatus TaxID=7918 RepID=UPI0035F525A4
MVSNRISEQQEKRGRDRRSGFWTRASREQQGQTDGQGHGIMLLPVFLLLSVLSVQVGGCDPFLKGVVSRLIPALEREQAGFKQVFPRDYRVPHHSSETLLCHTEAVCCVYSEGVLLSQSWSVLLSHLWSENLKVSFIAQVIDTLRDVSEQVFPETPDLSHLPRVSSSPAELLSLTTSHLSDWLRLNCTAPPACPFPTAPPGAEQEESSAVAARETGTGGGRAGWRGAAPPVGSALPVRPCLCLCLLLCAGSVSSL